MYMHIIFVFVSACAVDNYSTTTKLWYKRVFAFRYCSLINNMQSVTVVLLCALSVISAYDFEDQAYNRLIVEQLSLSNPRARRDTQTDCVDQDSCCSQDAIKNFHRDPNDEAISKQCYKEVNFDRGSIRGPLTDEQKNQIKCVVECIGKKKGYLNADGELIKSKLISNIKGKLQELDWLTPKLDDIFASCIPEDGNTAKQGKQCNDIGLTIGHCVWKKIQLVCPLDKQTNPGKCEKLQEYLKQNKRFPPPPPIKC
ncbi:hypothetical protein AMK59_6134 [Oryctes borbonicus]|uniref:Odorant binding protein n=1 Tax=Oryctes borbonicus TaxID=1629725 RepID=A0A0T6B476_9SCAR|nr:hypothetical protein AMK59_6134 [Oryctes borbonicus]